MAAEADGRLLEMELEPRRKAEALGYFRSDRAWLSEPVRALG